ncbi:MAG: alpha/beta fold hydrolase [Deltaproteobacteria bacterium]|nr:MAG: alpha/beta fold hydrolase [Deltaproteobacteria bacterium]
MRSYTIDLDGPIHYADFGGTGPTLVLVHGLGGSYVNWLAVAPALARSGRVLALALAGFGRTPLGERSAGVHANRVLLDRFLETVAPGPAILVGNSMGGLVAMMEAALAVFGSGEVRRASR